MRISYWSSDVCSSDLCERDLMERGMDGADTALLAQEAIGLQVEHARYLTLHDLCAMMAMPYDHAGLAPLWPVLETALLSPDPAARIDAPPEPPLYRERVATGKRVCVSVDLVGRRITT